MSDINAKMKQADAEFLAILQKHGLGDNLVLANNEYEQFDAYNDEVIVEFKRRNGSYDDYIIGMAKMGANYHYAQRTDKKFYFVVIDNAHIWVWDIMSYVETYRNLDFQVMDGLPTNQHRGDTRKIKKLIHMLPVSRAIIKRKL